MLSEITYEQFQEWQAYSTIDIWPDEKMDWHDAHVVSTIANLFRKKGESPNPVSDFLLKFGARAQNTWKQNKASLLMHLSLAEQVKKID